MMLPDELKDLNAWLVRDSKKVPYYVCGPKRHGRQGTREDRAKLVSLPVAAEAAKLRKMAGVGLAMLADSGLVALDFDGCVAGGIVLPEVLTLVAGTYAEVSPSGRGVRAFFRGALADEKDILDKASGKARSGFQYGFEVFHGKGYVTVTGNALPGAPQTIAPLPDSVRDYASRRFGRSEPAKVEGASCVAPRGFTIDRLRGLLTAFDPNASEPEWAEVLRALFHETGGSREGLALAIEWSATGTEKYSGPASVEAKWRSPSWRNAKHPITVAYLLRKQIAKPEDFAVVPTEAQDVNLLVRRRPLDLQALPADVLTRTYPERRWAVYPYAPALTVSLLLSVGGFGKSHALILLAICKALGLPNFCDCACTPGRVVILTAEDDLQEMQRRAQRVLRYLIGLGVSIDHNLLTANLQFVDLTGAGVYNMLIQAQHSGAVPTDLADHIAQQIGVADLIAIDTLSRFSGASENDNVAGAAFISACEVIAKRTGAAVLVLAHTGKQVAREGIVDQYVSRGASSFSDNARSVLVLASLSDAALKEYEIDPEAVKRGGVFRLAHVKSNYAKRAADVFFRRLEDGVVASFQPKARSVASEDELKFRLLTYVGSGEISRGRVKAEFDDIFGGRATRSQAFSVFDRAIREGALVHVRTFKLADYYMANRTMAAGVYSPMRAELCTDASDLLGDLSKFGVMSTGLGDLT